MPEESSAIYRILDASTNRATEGLRTLEELARFGLNDAPLSKSFKSLRHDLASALQVIPRTELLAARDVEADVGTSIEEASEYRRRDLRSVLQAASSRIQQSLRVMEECCKSIDGELPRRLEQLRYRSYSACARLEAAWPQWQQNRLVDKAKLYVLIDANRSGEAFERQVRELCQAGVDILQLRDRSVDDRTLIERGRRGTRIAREHDVLFIMNDRADLALAADCDGVHVGQEELTVDVARRIVGATRLIGVSTHSIEQARQAVLEGADYIGCGPVFAGQTKQFPAYVGTEFLTRVAAEIDLPAFAIGGIHAGNVEQVVAAGMRRIAVTGAIRDTKDPAFAVDQLKQILTASNESP